MLSFTDLGLPEPITRAIKELGFQKPTEIQEKALISLLDKDIDLIGLAQTGTGKTAAFGLPLLSKIDPQKRHVQALILSPTRELGQQIAEQMQLFGKYISNMGIMAVYGGASITNQIKDLKKAKQIVIATPGRLNDLIRRKAIQLENVDYVILDEADEMLNMGFKEDLDIILSHTPMSKKTWLFSATMPSEIERITSNYMDDPFRIQVSKKNEVNKNISHRYSVVTRANKNEALRRFLDLYSDTRAVIFCRTKAETQTLADELIYKNYKADALHGDLSQKQRDMVMDKFRKNEIHYLIATDVAARGIDVSDISHVFHFNIPDLTAYYTHRSGRTARAGRQGVSILFINGRENHKLKRLEKDLNIQFEALEIPQMQQIADKYLERWCQEVLSSSSKKINPILLSKASILFGNLSKDELLAKVLTLQLVKLNFGETKDINEKINQTNSKHASKPEGRRNKKSKNQFKSKSANPNTHSNNFKKRKAKPKNKKGRKS